MNSREHTRLPLVGGTPRLSPREHEVLRLIVQGNTSKDAAEELFISKRTVDFHLSNVYVKLGVNNRVEAIREAGRLGLIPVEPFLRQHAALPNIPDPSSASKSDADNFGDGTA